MKQIALIGTTASGKSALAIDLAKATGAVILSLDSLCIYRQINIASAKPSPAELAAATHFGIDIKSVDESFSAGEFFGEYERAVAFCAEQGRDLIITGGSGFYLKALISGLAPKVPRADFYPENNEIYALCESYDPEFSQKYSANDTFRLQKWFDIYMYLRNLQGRNSTWNSKNSTWNSRNPSENSSNFIWNSKTWNSKNSKDILSPSKFLELNTAPALIKDIDIYELCWDKDELRKRIYERTCAMLEAGLLDEAKELFATYSADLKPLNSIGLKECKEYLSSNITDQKKLIELISTHTAQLAKRQRTFFNSQFKSIKLQPKNAYEIILNTF